MTGAACPRCGVAVERGKFCPACGTRVGGPSGGGTVLGGRHTLGGVVAEGPFFATWSAEGAGDAVLKVLAPLVAADDGRRRRFLENAGAALTFPANTL